MNKAELVSAVADKAGHTRSFYPNGKTEILLNVPEYDFSWQTVYYFKQPKAIPAGTKVMVTERVNVPRGSR